MRVPEEEEKERVEEVEVSGFLQGGWDRDQAPQVRVKEVSGPVGAEV